MRLVAVVPFVVACSGTAAASAADPPGDPATAVTTFAPEVPAPAAERAGSCWTESSVSTRADAWRCAVGDAISDPCFTVSGPSGVVVCGANPATGERGFALRLDKPLPPRTAASAARPWLLLLADGEICSPFAGARPRVGGAFAQWYCAPPGSARAPSLVTGIERDGAWRVVLHAPSGAVARVAVRRAWM